MFRPCFLSNCVELRSALSEEKSKLSQPIRGQGWYLVIPIGPKKHKLGRGRWDIASCQVSLNSVQGFQIRSQKCLSKSEAGAAILFSDRPKNTHLVGGVNIMLPVMSCWFPVSGFREDVKNVSANQRLRLPSCFSDRHEKHRLCRERWDLATCQVLLHSFKRCLRRSRKYLRQSEAGAAILFSRSAR